MCRWNYCTRWKIVRDVKGRFENVDVDVTVVVEPSFDVTLVLGCPPGVGELNRSMVDKKFAIIIDRVSQR